MIRYTTLLWVGSIAIMLTLWGLYQAVPEHRRGNSSLTGIIAYGMSLLFWALFALHSSGYQRSLGSGVIEEVQTPSLMVVGVIGGGLSLLLLFDAVVRSLKG